MTLTRHLTNQTHIHDFSVTHDAIGWEVREEEDLSVLRVVHRVDWHRVERDTWLFELKASVLKEQGWIEH